MGRKRAAENLRTLVPGAPSGWDEGPEDTTGTTNRRMTPEASSAPAAASPLA